MRRLVRRLLLPRPRPARPTADAGLPGLLAGGIALLGVAAVPMTSVVVDTIDPGPDGAGQTASPPLAQGDDRPSASSGPIARVGLLPTGGVREALDATGDDGTSTSAAGTPHPAGTAVATRTRTTQQARAAIPDVPPAVSPDDAGDAGDAGAASDRSDETEARDETEAGAYADASDDAEAGDDGEAGGDDGDAEAGSDAEAGDAGTARTVWDDLADCESGDWDGDGRPIQGTARWDYGLQFAHEGYEQFQGGLNFHPDTWLAFKDADMPDHAGHASRVQQITVGERVRDAQGWQAWPVCSEMLGLR